MSELIQLSQLEEVTRSGAQILETNSTRAAKAVAVGKDILAQIAENGMSKELDERCEKYLVNCRGAKSEMEIARKPITAMFDQIRKQFTEAEAMVDVAKSESQAAKVQGHRNAFVQKLKQLEAERQAAAQKKIDQDNEAIELRAKVEVQLSEHVRTHLLGRKQKLQAAFGEITLENFDEKEKGLKGLIPVYPRQHFDDFKAVLFPRHLTAEQASMIATDVITQQDFPLIKQLAEKELVEFRNELVEKLPALKSHLEEAAKAGAAEKARLEAERKEREERDAAELQRQAEEKARKETEEIEQRKVSAQTESMMDNLQVGGQAAAPEARSGYSITILGPAGILEIVNFWFAKEGHALPIPEAEKKSVGQMKAFCEKHAHKTGETITSKFLKYDEVHKAVNRK